MIPLPSPCLFPLLSNSFIRSFWKGKGENLSPHQLQFDDLCALKFVSFIQRQTKATQETRHMAYIDAVFP